MCVLPTSTKGHALSIERWPLWLLPALLLSAVLHSATATHFEPIRVFALITPRAPEGGAVRLDVAEAPDGAWPTALIVRIRNRGSAPVPLTIAIRGSELARPSVQALRAQRFDIDLPPRKTPLEAPGQLEVTGPGDWVLEYVEVANLYGYSSGALAFIVVPRGTREYVRPASTSLWLATVLLLTLGAIQRPLRHRVGRRVHATLVGLVSIFLGLTLVAPLATSYAVVLSLQTFVLCALLVQAPVAVRVFRDYVWPALTANYRGENAPDSGVDSPPPARSMKIKLVQLGAGLTLAVAFVLLIAAHVRSLEPFFHDSDISLLGIYTDLAMRGDLLVGPYSRFIWHHPGPAYFYLLAPLYWLTNHNLQSLAWTAALINLGCLWLLLSRLHTRGGFGTLLAGGGVLLFFLMQTDGLVTSAWNPHVTLLPLAALMILCADFSSTVRFGALPLIVVLSSFLTQTHIGNVPCVAAMVAASAVLRLRFKPSGDAPSLRNRPADLGYLVASGVIFLAVWAPPILEEFSNNPGNLTLLYQFFRSSGQSQGWDAVGVFVHSMSALPLGRLHIGYGSPAAMDFGWLASGAVLAQLVLLWPVSRWAHRRGRDFHVAICLIGLTGSIVALWSVNRIVGPILGHLVFWLSALSLINLTAIFAVVTCQGWDYLRRGVPHAWRTRHWRHLPAAMVLIAAALYLPRLVDEQRRSGAGSPAVKAVFGEFRAYLDQHDLHRPSIRIAPSAWELTAGVILELSKVGHLVAVEPRWIFMFTEAFAANGKEDAQFEIVDRSFDTLGGLLENERVASGGDFTIYRRFSLGTVRRLSQPAQILRSTGISGNPSVIVDGRVLADGSDWNAKGTLRFEAKGSSVTIAVPDTATGVELSADANDSWRLDCSDDGFTFDLVGVIPVAAGHGLRTRQAHFRRLTTCRQLTISPRAGDGMFSMSEVTFLSATVYRGPSQ